MNSASNPEIFSFAFDGLKVEIVFQEFEDDYGEISTTNFYVINWLGFIIKFRGLHTYSLDDFHEIVERVKDPLTLQTSFIKITQITNNMRGRGCDSDRVVHILEKSLMEFVAVGEKRTLNYDYDSDHLSDVEAE